MLVEKEWEILSGETVGSDKDFLGSDLLSHRTDNGVELAALKASMA